MNPNNIGNLVDHLRDNGPTRIRHDGVTYEVKVWDTFKFATDKETR